MPILINRQGVDFIGNFITDLLKYVCFESCDGFFVHGFEEDRPKDSER